MKSQDPSASTGGTDFSTQLAQYSQIEPLSNMTPEIQNQSFKHEYVGADAGRGYDRQDRDRRRRQYAYDERWSGGCLATVLAKDAAQVEIDIRDQSGNLVKSHRCVRPERGGANQVTWGRLKRCPTVRILTQSRPRTVKATVSMQRRFLRGPFSAVPIQEQPDLCDRQRSGSFPEQHYARRLADEAGHEHRKPAVQIDGRLFFVGCGPSHSPSEDRPLTDIGRGAAAVFFLLLKALPGRGGAAGLFSARVLAFRGGGIRILLYYVTHGHQIDGRVRERWC